MSLDLSFRNDDGTYSGFPPSQREREWEARAKVLYNIDAMGESVIAQLRKEKRELKDSYYRDSKTMREELEALWSGLDGDGSEDPAKQQLRRALADQDARLRSHPPFLGYVTHFSRSEIIRMVEGV